MPAIGATLREARMRARIDISEIESETKIRAKYLRALENEEWDLLPGPTYVKSFLRTYADALGLDSRLLLEEYKLRHERLSDIELQPIAPPGSRRGPSTRRSRGGIPRAYVVWFLVLAVLAGIYLLGRSTEDNGTSPPKQPANTPTTPSGGNAGTHKKSKAAPKYARLQVLGTAPVYVCVKAAGNRTLVNGETLAAGGHTNTYRSSRFDVTLGNGSAKMRVNGRLMDVPDVQSGIGYRVTVKGRRTLSPGKRPTCA
ncbi:MAG: helix-turn-helix domain-containing protein [Actinobacteria bacterium]|nr:MAG: helix-turn-helix domain-containing protein [Actinomycetota bacterium]